MGAAVSKSRRINYRAFSFIKRTLLLSRPTHLLCSVALSQSNRSLEQFCPPKRKGFDKFTAPRLKSQSHGRAPSRNIRQPKRCLAKRQLTNMDKRPVVTWGHAMVLTNQVSGCCSFWGDGDGGVAQDLLKRNDYEVEASGETFQLRMCPSVVRFWVLI